MTKTNPKPSTKGRRARLAGRLHAPGPLEVLLAASALTMVVEVPSGPVRATLGMAAALLIPGWAVLAVAIGDRMELDVLPRLAISVMVSLAVYPLVVIAENAIGARFSRTDALLGVDVVLLVCTALLGWHQRDRTGHRSASEADAVTTTSLWGPLMWAGAVIVAGVLLIAAWASFGHVRPAPYESISLLGASSATESVLHADGGGTLSVSVSVANGSPHAERYTLTGLPDASSPWLPVVIDVPAHGRWTGMLAGGVGADGCARRLNIEATRDDLSVPPVPLSVAVWFTAGTPKVCTSR